MNLRTALASLLGRATRPARTGPGADQGPHRRGWYDVDRTLAVPAGTTLSALLEIAQREGLPLRDAIEASPHLRHTLMWTGERCPVDEHAARPLEDGDSLYLLAPIAGG